MTTPQPYRVSVNAARGAPMGRPDTGAIDPDSRARRVRLRSVPLHEGYDPGGAYWGERRPGEMLFCAWSRDFVRFMDARSYLLVEEMIRRQFPNAEFCG